MEYYSSNDPVLKDMIDSQVYYSLAIMSGLYMLEMNRNLSPSSVAHNVTHCKLLCLDNNM